MTLFKVTYENFKREDNTNNITVELFNDDQSVITPNTSHSWKAKLAMNDKFVGEYPVSISGTKIFLSSANLARLPKGDYQLEFWETSGNSITIYPSAGFIPVRIHRNTNDMVGTIDPTVDITKIIQDLHKAGQNIKIGSVTTTAPGTSATITQHISGDQNIIDFTIPQGAKGDKGDKGDKGEKGDQGVQGPKGEKGEIGDAYYNFNAAESDSLYSLFLNSYISKNSLDTSGKFNFGFNNVASTTDVATGITRGTFKNSNSNTGIYWFYDTSFITPSKQYIFSLKVRGKNYAITKYGEEANAYTNKIVTDEYAWTTLNFMFQAKKNIVIYGNFTDNDGFLDIDRNSLKIIDCTEIAVTNLATSTSVSIPVNTSYPTWSVANVTNTLTPGHYFISYTADANKTRVRVYDGASNDYTETYGGFNQNSNIVYYEFNVPYNASNAKVGIYSSPYNVAATTTVNINKLIIGKMSDKVGG